MTVSPLDIKLKRAYERPAASDGTRILIDRLWPRGIKKEAAAIDRWLRDLAPSNELRKWFGHDPAKRVEFEKRYFQELEQHPDLVEELLQRAVRGRLTLLFASRELELNNAVALKHYLEKKSR